MDIDALERDLIAQGFSKLYAHTIAVIRGREERARSGKVVIRPGRDRQPGVPIVGSPPNLHYLGYELSDTATQEWRLFTQEVHTENVGHTHQGGLALFVLEGKGATVMNGVRHPWKAGDLILLPITPGGVHHQHLSFDGNANWIAFWFDPVMQAIGTQMIPDATSVGAASRRGAKNGRPRKGGRARRA